MKNKEQIKNEIKRLKTQITKISKKTEGQSAFIAFAGVNQIIILDANIKALQWVIDEENKTELGFNLKSK